MADKQGIIAAITQRVQNSKTVNFSSWRIGITHDLEERYDYWKNQAKEVVEHWLAWEAASLADAQYIENHFINTKKMKGGTGGNMSERKTAFVYIF